MQRNYRTFYVYDTRITSEVLYLDWHIILLWAIIHDLCSDFYSQCLYSCILSYARKMSIEHAFLDNCHRGMNNLDLMNYSFLIGFDLSMYRICGIFWFFPEHLQFEFVCNLLEGIPKRITVLFRDYPYYMDDICAYFKSAEIGFDKYTFSLEVSYKMLFFSSLTRDYKLVKFAIAMSWIKLTGW